MRCKRAPTIRNVNVPATPATQRITFDADCVAFIIRERTGALGMQIRVEDGAADYFSLGAGETYSEEQLKLDAELTLFVSASGAAVAEVWEWAA